MLLLLLLIVEGGGLNGMFESVDSFGGSEASILISRVAVVVVQLPSLSCKVRVAADRSSSGAGVT